MQRTDINSSNSSQADGSVFSFEQNHPGEALCMPCQEEEADSSDDIDSDIISIASTARKKMAMKSRVPLQAWVDYEQHKMTSRNDLSLCSQLNLQKAGLLRKLTVAFAIGKMLDHLKASVLSYSQDELLHMCSPSNFAIHIAAVSGAYDDGWEVAGIDMLSPPMSLQVISYHFDSSNFFFSTDEGESWGRDTRVEVTMHSPFCCAKQAASRDGADDDKSICYALGVLLEFIFSEGSSLGRQDDRGVDKQVDEILRALSISPRHETGNSEHSHDSRPAKFASMPAQSQEYDTPSNSLIGPISRLVRDLLGCQTGDGIVSCSDTCYLSLDAAIQDMHQLLMDPNKYIFQSNNQLPPTIRMYGRSAESKMLLDSFCRVASSGQSEAFVIAGLSGSGKTRLVQSVTDSVLAANGVLVKKKFEQNSTNQLSLVLSAFNDISTILAESNSNTEHLWRSILSEFGSYLYMLVQTLPNVIRLVPSPTAALSLTERINDGDGGDVNFFSLCDIIKRFMRAIKTASRPVMMFLDDLQWADSISLGLIHTVLSDEKGASCLFFVGSYRPNEVPEHHILHGFQQWLSAFNVSYNTVHLGGITEDNVLSMVSESLGMLPRCCQSLAQVVFRKTEGNPFFVQTFIRSLVDKYILTYSLRERSWEWSIDEVHAENITPNVLDLLSSKMAVLSENSQTALKVAACFGFNVDVSVVENLSKCEQYTNLLVGINTTVDSGLMQVDPDGTYYQFVHDKVREASYDLISPGDRTKYHFDIGMALLARFETEQVEVPSDILPSILDQLNHGVPELLHSRSQHISICKLNHKAASKMMQCYNYVSAYELSKTTISLLPDDSWQTHYDLSLEAYFLLSKAAYSNREIGGAKDALNMVVQHASSLRTKLNAYSLQCFILLSACSPKEMNELLNTIVATLEALGEKLPCHVSPTDISSQIRSAQLKVGKESDNNMFLLNKVSTESQTNIMQAYNILTSLAYVARPKLYPYFAARWVQYTLEHKVSSKYTPASFVTFAVVLCRDMSDENITVGRRIGKLGLRLLNQCDSANSELSVVHLLYYGHIGILFEPMQACVDMHCKAYDVGQQVGNISIAALHKQFLIARQLHSGTNLIQMKDNLDMDIKMLEHVYSFPMLAMKLRVYYDAVLTLIGDESSSTPTELSGGTVFDQEPARVLTSMMTSTYLGHYERVKHLYKKWESLNDENQSKQMIGFRSVYINFYYGLSAILLQKKKKSTSKRSREVTNRWLEVLNSAAACSPWNFGNKAKLLQAEKLSLSMKNTEAEELYDVAVSLAHSSKFVHEEGLACELAGMHHEKQGNYDKALALFRQAEHCYQLWGSASKCRQMKEKINYLDHDH